MSELVSVIIPYFRKKNYIKKCINSIINQTYKNIEIIIIYDDQDKEDLKYIKSFIKIKKNIKVIINKKNLGVGKSRNLGIKKSKGSYISFLDSDDYWDKNKVSYQLSFMKKNKILFSHTNYFIINENDKILGIMKVQKDLNYRDLIRSCDIGTSSVMIKKKILRANYFPNFKTKEDYFLWLKLAKKNIAIKGINKNLIYWRKTKNSLSSSFIQKLIDAFKVYYSNNQNILISIYNVMQLSIFFIFKKFKQKIYLYK